MFFCEECRVKRRWPQSFGGSYGNCEICGKTDSCYDVPSKYLPPVKAKDDVHTAHCCQMHGCKYFGAVGGETACPVKKNGGQEYMCEVCSEEIYEDGGWEDAHFANEMFNKGRKSAWAEIVKIAQKDWTLCG